MGDRSAQKEESSGGHTPRGYPGQALPLGPGESSGMCRVTDMSTDGISPRSDQVWSRTLTSDTNSLGSLNGSFAQCEGIAQARITKLCDLWGFPARSLFCKLSISHRMI